MAITRARKRLYLTCAQTGQIFGETQANPISRFVSEIPADLRKTMGVGSAGYLGVGWEKRGSRRGISGSGVEAGRGDTFNRSSAGGGTGSFGSFGGSGAGSAGKGSVGSSVAGLGVGNRTDVGKKAAADMSFAKGDRIDHRVFGRGTVTEVSGNTLAIRFDRTGVVKKLLKDYAPIVKVNE